MIRHVLQLIVLGRPLGVDQFLDHVFHLDPTLLEGRGIDIEAEQGAEDAKDRRSALGVHEVPGGLSHQADPRSRGLSRDRV